MDKQSNKYLIATNNKGKVKELIKLLKDYNLNLDLISLKEAGIAVEYEETGNTFMENAIGKSLFYGKFFPNMITIADDSGLSVKSLNGKPGVYSARYAGPDSNDENNIIKLLKAMETKKERDAEFVTVIALSYNGKLIKTFEGRVSGIILNEKQGLKGFGYDPIFYYPPLKKTFAELSVDIKNEISHRARAVKKLIQYLNSPNFINNLWNNNL